jgi:hypothetical protein
MYLVDTNIWLERLLNQDKADEVRRFLNLVSARDLSNHRFHFPFNLPNPHAANTEQCVARLCSGCICGWRGESGFGQTKRYAPFG